ncbi:hypothetical protein [Streptomyces capoamus]|uniref:Uncharacterized protein n=1 Tax=Streptomyces capoamus TaxID=68183 RepID=A0A919EUP0_9ACTN|nr:hypothetical protein [Streptomyces capoamus]GGW12520.1 hypothetical protein GCM10010501_12670 [Streptomyces libani subsp. rufus]GHG34819.1 hypothetical protein GCM10018980_04680 [Streptomyces capoamus]
MSEPHAQENEVEVDPTTDTDEEALDRAVTSRLVADSENRASMSESRPGNGPVSPAQPENGRPVARRQPTPD